MNLQSKVYPIVRTEKGLFYWKSIARKLDMSELAAKEAHKKSGLPVKFDGQTPILTSIAYLRWIEKLPDKAA